MKQILKEGQDLEKTKEGLPGCQCTLEPNTFLPLFTELKRAVSLLMHWVLRAPLEEQAAGFSFPAESIRLKWKSHCITPAAWLYAEAGTSAQAAHLVPAPQNPPPSWAIPERSTEHPGIFPSWGLSFIAGKITQFGYMISRFPSISVVSDFCF